VRVIVTKIWQYIVDTDRLIITASPPLKRRENMTTVKYLAVNIYSEAVVMAGQNNY